MRLTDKTIAALAMSKGKVEAIHYDDDLPGFGLRLRAGGSRRWVYTYRIGVRDRRITLGSPTALSAGRARTIAAELAAKVRLGNDPAGEKHENRARAAETMGATLTAYLAVKRETVRSGSYTGIERHLAKHCRRLHGVRIDKIDRRAIAATLTTIAAKSGPIEANRVRASLSAFFAWCMREGLAAANPVIGTGRRPERSRDRVLTDVELKAIWSATVGNDDYSAIIRLLTLTGARANEIAALSWPEVDDDRITLPALRTKNKRDHVIPLSEPAQVILDRRPRRADRDFIFGRRNGRPFSGWSVCKGLLDARIKDKGVTLADWTPHDLRRTTATRMAELGVQPHIIEAVLNHVSGHKHGVAGIYNRATYEPDKRQALALWAEHLLAIVEGRKRVVVPLKRGTA
jgi:integrase